MRPTENIAMLEQTLRYIGTRVLPVSFSAQREALVLLPEDVRALIAQTDLSALMRPGKCAVDCENTDSFSAALTMAQTPGEKEVLVLNFANPVNPGGGVRRGANAQEEDLCRKSTLLLSLEGDEALPYYEYNRKLDTYMGSDGLILSPKVVILRDRRGDFLEKTATVAVLTSAAPMLTYGMEGMTFEEYRAMLLNRVKGMLVFAAARGYRRLVLGAWGCGAFHNDAAVVADVFAEALRDFSAPGETIFDEVFFAVLSRSAEQYNYKEFARRFKKADAPSSADKIAGCLFGGAAGDALGYTVEFDDEDSIFSRYPGGIKDYVPVGGKARFSDDTQMTLFTAAGLLSWRAKTLAGKPADPVDCLRDAYLDWLVTQSFSGGKDTPKSASWLRGVPGLYVRRAPGNTCLSALAAQTDGKTKADIAHPLNRSKGCGGVMRAAPAGLLDLPELTDGEIARLAAEAAAVTHGHPLGWLPAAALAVTVHALVFGDAPDVKAAAEKAIAVTNAVFADERQTKTLSLLLEKAIALAANAAPDLDNIHALGEGWVGEEALAIGLYAALRHEDDFSACLVAAVNHRGDADSTGAVAGNILGAKVGLAGIDEKWTAGLEMTDVLTAVSADLKKAPSPDGEWREKYDR